MAHVLSIQHWEDNFDYYEADFFARRSDARGFAYLFAGQSAPDQRLFGLAIQRHDDAWELLSGANLLASSEA
jgi:hypothetical protein